MQLLLLLDGEDAEGGEVLAEQQRGLLQRRQLVADRGEFRECLGEGGVGTISPGTENSVSSSGFRPGSRSR